MAQRLIQDREGHVIAREMDAPDGSVQVFDRMGRYLGRATRNGTYDRSGLLVTYGFSPGALYGSAFKAGPSDSILVETASLDVAKMSAVATPQVAAAPVRQRHAPLADGTTHTRMDGTRFALQRIHDQMVDELHDRGYEYVRHHDEALPDGSEFSVAILQRRAHPGVDPVLMNYWSGPAPEAGMTDPGSVSRDAPAGLLVVGHPLGRDEYAVDATSGAVSRIPAQSQQPARA